MMQSQKHYLKRARADIPMNDKSSWLTRAYGDFKPSVVKWDILLHTILPFQMAVKLLRFENRKF
ncbi:MAG: hypothetical protein BRD50_07865 [Bacteroidetes bacterium SW_11_45_7]|nr:MAG: hypothetical protein BRD50_07865 [Bacteroidetes bacterium SW_11_45_7]